MVEYRNRSVVRQWSEYMPSTQTIQVGTSLKVTFFVTMLFEKKNVSEKQTGVGSYLKRLCPIYRTSRKVILDTNTFYRENIY